MGRLDGLHHGIQPTQVDGGGDPEGRSLAEILVDVVAAEVIEPWGGGKWHLEIFRSSNPEPEDWNGEM